MRVILSGGGTGGHIYPAIAIADALRSLRPETEVLFVGAEGKMEMEKVPQAGYDIVGLPIQGLQRRLSAANLALPFKLLASLRKAKSIIATFQPDVAVGTGGYASAAVLQMAALSGVPILLQEQNGYAGLTNKLLSRWADRICVAYPDMEQYFPATKLLFTGNPVRQDISALFGADPSALRRQAAEYFGLDPARKTLLIIGGSLGARTLNEAMQAGLNELLSADIQVLWQTGKAYFPALDQAFLPRPRGLWMQPFVSHMHLAYSIADVVVSRAGALSISELTLAAKAAILVPSPNVAEDHQTKNARALTQVGAALLVSDAEARTQLVPAIRQLIADDQRRSQLAQAIASLARPNAALSIAEQIILLAEEEK